MGEKKEGRVTSRPYGRLQVVRGKRKLFGRERQQVFLEHLLATCNLTWSAEAAGVTPQCIYQRVKRDAAFCEALERTIELAYPGLELRLLAESNGTGTIEVRGDVAPEEGPLDKDLALHLLREHKRGGGAGKAGPPLRSASWGEVEEYFTARLKALRVRIDGGGGALPHGPSTIPKQVRDGPPPRSGEEL